MTTQTVFSLVDQLKKQKKIGLLIQDKMLFFISNMWLDHQVENYEKENALCAAVKLKNIFIFLLKKVLKQHCTTINII